MAKLLRMISVLSSFFKPAGGKCPGCGSTGGWTLDHTGPYGEKYWKCDSCGYKIKDWDKKSVCNCN